MRGLGAKFRASYVAALLAVALLTLAGVRSVVMRAAEAAPTSTRMCMDMPGMDMGTAAKTGAHAEHGKAHKVCEFCSAASHAPICGVSPPVHKPALVAWAAWRSRSTLGPRGPPAFAAKARGPPDLLTF